jgi:hypothetical protein
MTKASKQLVAAFALPLMLSGCAVAGAAADIVTAPVDVASKGVDWATTSQSEADEKRGRALREREERLGKLARQRDRHAEDCFEDRERDACREYEALDAEIDRLRSAPLD